MPGITAAEYLRLIDRRFANPAIVDTVRRVAFDGSARHVGFLLPSVRDGLADGVSVTGLALVEALWARMCAGTREDGSHIEPNDPMWDMLTATAATAQHTPTAWLEMTHIYHNLADQPRFAAAFEGWLTCLYRDGVENTVSRYLDLSGTA
jgi:mannitol 2-dehydrogenase